MHVMTPMAAYVLLVAFSALMIFATSVASRAHKWHTAVGFMAAGRSVPWWLGAVSICVTWIWAPALFISSKQSYENGLPGIFWFTVPNILSLMIVAPLAVRIREFLPAGYTQPEWIRHRFDERVHKMYLLVFFWYQLIAVTMQLYAGGSIFSLLTGVPLQAVMLVLAGTTLTYSIISGMRASIVTDFLQYSMIVIGGLLIIPWTLASAGGLGAVSQGLGGITGTHTSIFDGQVAFEFGIVTSIGLICGSLGDQQNWQRAFSIEQGKLFAAYILAGLLFGIVPIALSTLGFLAANPALAIHLPDRVDSSMIGVATVAHYLPGWAVVAFIIMMLGGLCATMDSAMCATSSLFCFNCLPVSNEERKANLEESLQQTTAPEAMKVQDQWDKRILLQGRLAMGGITLAGLLLAFAILYIPGFNLQFLWWTLNSVGMCIAVPTVLSLYWDKLDAKGIYWGTLLGFLIGVPLFVYSNMIGQTWLTVVVSISILAVSALFCVLFQRKEPFIFESALAVDRTQTSSSEVETV
jgi:Na+/proline symporter